MTRLLSAAAAVALLSGAAVAQTAAPAQAPAAAPPATKVSPNGDLIATAQASGQFTTFLKALDATNLTSVLKTNPNLTVFAPTDAAFAALPAGELDRLMQPANAAQLQKVLTYHVINTKVDSSKINGAKGEVKTVEGSSVTLDGSGTTAMVDGAHIVQADVVATNGVLHVVDKVLIPKDVPIQAAAATDDAATSMASTTASADVMSATDAGSDVAAQAAPAASPAPDQATTPSATDAPADQALNPTASPAPADPTAATTAPAATGAAAPASATLPASTSTPEEQATLKAGDPNVVSNPPVADTPENRKAYGKPMSNAGKRSAAKGN
ncbi:fasciclin domain-containing protein [Caulobacter hibisci]|uniref:Fasciclin domain-containing protein n=1 Tax=Caulobacter hibisci TaxID=2035993 RepID=A0ABS0STP3_9CAUL|nr:fasciclin domain-containing protein [Caulobacter hibisci]